MKERAGTTLTLAQRIGERRARLAAESEHLRRKAEDWR